MKIAFKILFCFCSIISFTAFPDSSFATTRTWTGLGGDNNWMNGANWGGTAPSANDDLIFAGSTNTSTSNNFPGGTNFHSITFASGASGFSISGSSITVNGGASAITDNSTSTQTISIDITYITTTPTITVVSGGTLALNGATWGSVGLTKSGTGILSLGNTHTTYWTGTTTVSAGSLLLGDPGGDNYASLIWQINSGATLKWSSINNVVTNNAVMTVNTGGTIDFNGQADAIGDLAGGGNVINIGGTVYLVKPPAGTGSDFSGIASGSGSLVAGAGFANVQILSGSNTYTGQSGIQQGTFSINTIKNVGGGASSLGAPTTVANGTIAIGSNGNTGILQYTGTTQSTNRVIDLSGTTGGATLDQSGTGLLTFTSAFTASGSGAKTLTLQGSTSGTGLLSGAIVNSGGGATSLLKTGTGTWTLSGTNTYTGTTTINGGTLTMGASGVISSSSNFIMSGGTLSTGVSAGFSENVGTLTLTGNSTIAIGTGSHSLHFAASNSTSWTAGQKLTITGWQGGYNCSSGTSGQMFTGSSAELSAAKLAQIVFVNPGNGFTYSACQLNTGEIVPTNIALPVTLISFTGKKVNNANELNWSTVNESNSNYFEVLRSSDGINFETIGNVNAAGNSSAYSTYNFTDDAPFSGVNYYKLIEYDFNGASTTSTIIAINDDAGSVFKIDDLYPNPASGSVTVNVESEVAGSYTITLYDLLGRKLTTMIIEGAIGKNQFHLPVDNYSNGKYFVRIVNPKNESAVSPIIVQH